MITVMEDRAFAAFREEVLRFVEPRIKPKRFIHTLGVEKQALHLASLYLPDDLQSVSLAALLHDNAKSLPGKKQLSISKEAFPDVELSQQYESILHAFAGAVEAKEKYSDLSSDIVNAIAFHTTGRPGMSTLEKIIYCADFTELNREPFDGLEEARKLLDEDLDKGLLMILKHTAAYVRQQKKDVHPLTLETIRFYEKEINNHG